MSSSPAAGGTNSAPPDPIFEAWATLRRGKRGERKGRKGKMKRKGMKETKNWRKHP